MTQPTPPVPPSQPVAASERARLDLAQRLTPAGFERFLRDRRKYNFWKQADRRPAALYVAVTARAHVEELYHAHCTFTPEYLYLYDYRTNDPRLFLETPAWLREFEEAAGVLLLSDRTPTSGALLVELWTSRPQNAAEPKRGRKAR